MAKTIVILLTSLLLASCAPGRLSSYCWGQPNYQGLADTERNAKIGELSDEALLDYAACRVVSRHPPGIDFPSELVTTRSPRMAARILDRIVHRDEGLISMEYTYMLSEMVEAEPTWLSGEQRAVALSACIRHNGGEHSLCRAFEQ